MNFQVLRPVCIKSSFQLSFWYNQYNSLDGNAKLKNSAGSHGHYKSAPFLPLKI